MPNIDRRDDEMPTQSLLMRYQSLYPRRSAYAKPDNFKPAPLNREAASPIKQTGKSIRDRIKEDGKKKQLEHNAFANPSGPQFEINENYKGPKPAPASKSPTKRFCGGKSKPYKRK